MAISLKVGERVAMKCGSKYIDTLIKSMGEDAQGKFWIVKIAGKKEKKIRSLDGCIKVK